MSTRQSTIRAPERTWTQIAELAEQFGTQTAVIIVAVDRLYQTERKENIMDRVAQVDWIDELAGNIAANLGEGTAEELVDYALSDEGRESWGIELPDWFDDHDRRLLTERVAAQL